MSNKTLYEAMDINQLTMIRGEMISTARYHGFNTDHLHDIHLIEKIINQKVADAKRHMEKMVEQRRRNAYEYKKQLLAALEVPPVNNAELERVKAKKSRKPTGSLIAMMDELQKDM